MRPWPSTGPFRSGRCSHRAPGLTWTATPTSLIPFADSLIPAWQDEKFDRRVLPGYFSQSSPAGRRVVFYGRQDVDPAVAAFDWEHRGMLSTAESNDVAVAAERVLDMRLPVLEVLGEFDPCFGGGPDRDATPTAAGLVRHESPHLGKAVPLVEAFIVPGDAHRRLRLPLRRCSPSSRIGCPGWNVPQPTTTSASPVEGVRRRTCGPARSGRPQGAAVALSPGIRLIRGRRRRLGERAFRPPVTLDG